MLTQTVSRTENYALPRSNSAELSDIEIFRRVRDIRAGWSPAEKAARRREAERRFADLISRLGEG